MIHFIVCLVIVVNHGLIIILRYSPLSFIFQYIIVHIPVPQDFQAFLPSSPVSNLDPQRDKWYILESLLKNASLEAWQWMLKTYRDEDIIHMVKTSRILIPKDVMIWCHYFHIPSSEVKCLQPKSPSTPRSSWPY